MIALFGKLPARRDFIARDVPNPVLEVVEPFLQGGLAQSRESLGKGWLDAYLAAPMWRFWWAQPLAGVGIAGVMMPSVDRVGRYFPLLAMALAPRGFDIALPSAGDDAWYLALETALLDALDETATLDDLLARLAALPAAPPLAPAGAALSGSLWWTLGGTGMAPRRAAYAGFPPPTAFAELLFSAADKAEPAP